MGVGDIIAYCSPWRGREASYRTAYGTKAQSEFSYNQRIIQGRVFSGVTLQRSGVLRTIQDHYRGTAPTTVVQGRKLRQELGLEYG